MVTKAMIEDMEIDYEALKGLVKSYRKQIAELEKCQKIDTTSKESLEYGDIVHTLLKNTVAVVENGNNTIETFIAEYIKKCDNIEKDIEREGQSLWSSRKKLRNYSRKISDYRRDAKKLIKRVRDTQFQALSETMLYVTSNLYNNLYPDKMYSYMVRIDNEMGRMYVYWMLNGKTVAHNDPKLEKKEGCTPVIARK